MVNSSYLQLLRYVAGYRRALIAVRVGRTVLITGTLCFGLLALLQIAFAFFPWTMLPLAADIAILAGGLFCLCYGMAHMTFRRPGLVAVARRIERRTGMKNALISLSIELTKDLSTQGNPFTLLSCDRAAAEIVRCPRLPVVPRSLPMWAVAGVVLAVGCFLNPLLSPRLLDYWKIPFVSLARPACTISPGNITVPSGRPITFRLVPQADRYPSCRLTIFTPNGERRSSVLLRPEENGAFLFRLDSVRTSFVYQFSIGGGALNADTVIVVPPPRLLRLAVTLEPPAYTRKPARPLPEGQGNFEAYEGSRARFTIESAHLSKAWLIAGKDSLGCTGSGKLATVELLVRSPTTYSFALVDSLGQTSDSLPLFTIGIVPDEPPAVQIVKPGFNKELQPDQAETLAVEGIDDIGIRSMSLRWKKGGDQRTADGVRDLSDPSRPPVIRTAFVWQLTELSLYPGDTAFYWAEAVDTKPFGSQQRDVSDTFWFRIPRFDEIHKRIAQKEAHAEKAIDAVREGQKEMAEKLENVLRTSSGKEELSWEQKQILRDVKEGLEKQNDSLKTALSSLQESIEKMREQGTVGEEIARKMERVRASVDELIKKYGDSLLFNFKDLEKPVSWQDLRQAIERAEAMLPKLGEQLDNVLKFLDMLRQDKKLAELAMRAEQLSREQKSMSQSAGGEQASMEQQKELLERIQQLQKDIAAGGRSDSSLAAKLDSLGSMSRLDSLRKAMRTSVAQRMAPARESMNQMSGALLSLSQELMQMMNFNEAVRLERERELLLALARSALTLADWQDEIRQDNGSSEDAAAVARSQQALRDALAKSRAIAESLSMVPPDDMLSINAGFKGAFSAFGEVLGALRTGEAGEPMAQSGSALRSLGNSALSALSKLEGGGQSQGCSGGSCMMPGLRRISGRQASINSITSELLRRMLGGTLDGKPGGTAQEMDAARRSAQKAQQEIAGELKRLADQYGNQSGETMTGKVKSLEEEARRIATLLERPTQEATEHQDRFLARMLETTLSMHREGEGKEERKSRTAMQLFQEGAVPEKGDFFKDQDTFHRLRQKAFNGNFPEGYRSALRAYFDALSEKYLK